MFRDTYQSGQLSILYSCGASPLELWGMQVKNGYIRRVTDEEVKSLALEITGTNVSTTFIYAPKNRQTVLAINLPFMIMIIKNMKKYFTFEITILDDKHMHRRFRLSNFQSATKVRPFSTSMPIGLCNGWNQIHFNLADFTKRAYGSNYVETTRMQIHANCRIRRVYFVDRIYTDEELPEEYRLLFPSRREEVPERRPSRRSQAKIPVEVVPGHESPAFHGDAEKTDTEIPRQTTPVDSPREPSHIIVAPEASSKVQIEIAAPSEDEEEEEERVVGDIDSESAVKYDHEDDEKEHEDDEKELEEGEEEAIDATIVGDEQHEAISNDFEEAINIGGSEGNDDEENEETTVE